MTILDLFQQLYHGPAFTSSEVHPGYSIVREDKIYNGPTATAGGVALLVPQDWSCLKVNIQPTGDQCESLTVIVTPIGENAKSFKLNTLYNHPGNHISPTFITNLKNHLSNGKNLPLLIVGDLNCPHQAFGSRTTNEYGNSLLQIINNESLILINDDKEPTYFSNASGLHNILDLVIADIEMNRLITCCGVSGDVGSDHLPVVTTLNLKIKQKLRQIVNMKQWSSNIESRLARYEATRNINENIHAVGQIFKETKEQSTFTCKTLRRNLPIEIRQYINLRRSLLKCKKKSTTDLARRVVTRQYNRINRIVQQKLKEHDMKSLEKLASDICQTESLGKMWKLYNNYTNKEDHIEEPETPLKCPGGSFTTNNKEKCDEFARYLSTVHQTPENPIFDIEFKREIDRSIEEQ